MKNNKNIPLFKVYMSKDATKRVSEVLESGFIGQGPVVDQFEDKLKDFFDNDYVTTVNAATSAEHLALHMLKKPCVNKVAYGGVSYHESNWPGIEEGDEVLATPLTCTATNFPILA
ncbi:DegT/DnrJ/EryC1/StrS family aminotransferase, partial [bacterium]|nr:DegT/DnrJ/EryC1/StrS family aminotransferase [bacterium]